MHAEKKETIIFVNNIIIRPINADLSSKMAQVEIAGSTKYTKNLGLVLATIAAIFLSFDSSINW